MFYTLQLTYSLLSFPRHFSSYRSNRLHILYQSNTTTDMSSQSYFKGHDDDIMCLAMSPCRLFVATGQTASKTSKVILFRTFSSFFLPLLAYISLRCSQHSLFLSHLPFTPTLFPTLLILFLILIVILLLRQSCFFSTSFSLLLTSSPHYFCLPKTFPTY